MKTLLEFGAEVEWTKNPKHNFPSSEWDSPGGYPKLRWLHCSPHGRHRQKTWPGESAYIQVAPILENSGKPNSG